MKKKKNIIQDSREEDGDTCQLGRISEDEVDKEKLEERVNT